MERNKASHDSLSSVYNPAHYFAYASSLYLTLLSMPLLLFPRVLLLLSTPRGAAGQAPAAQDPSQAAGAGAGAPASQGVSALGPELTPIERFASYGWAMAMISLSLMVLTQTGSIPLTSKPIADAAASGAASPYRFPAVLILTLYFSTMATLSWISRGTGKSATEVSSIGDLGIGTFGTLLALPHAALALAGFGVLMFGNDMTRNKKKEGDASAKDKSTSSFPFKNAYAEGEKNK